MAVQRERATPAAARNILQPLSEALDDGDNEGIVMMVRVRR